MPWLETPRLQLVPTPLEVLETRLLRAGFAARIDLGGREARVAFPAEWPGDALALFPALIARRRRHPAAEEWGGVVIDRSELVAAGQMGFRGPPDAHGRLDLGYGINRAYRNRGYATEMARALVEWALRQPGVRVVTAECLVGNRASARVLEKVGFERAGRRVDAEGRLLVWEYR